MTPINTDRQKNHANKTKDTVSNGIFFAIQWGVKSNVDMAGTWTMGSG